MQNALLMIYPIILLAMTFYGAVVSKKGLVSDTFIDYEQGKNIQAAACIAIIIHHVTQQITVYGMRPKGPITLFSYIGYLFTAIFFFFSGYGLITSVNNKPGYLKSFLKRRLSAVLVPFWLINVLGVLMTFIFSSRRLTVTEIIFDITGITLINGNGWFIIEIALLYFFFFFLFSIIKNKDLASGLLCLATVLLIIFCFFQGHDPEGDKSHFFRGEWWYNSTITFAYGVLFARFRDRFISFCQKNYKLMVTLFAVLTFLFMELGKYAQQHLGYYHEAVHGGFRDALITLIIQSISCIVFVTFLAILNMKISIGNRALRFISSISLELFLIHGFFVSLVFGNREMSDFMRYGAVIVCSVICAAIVSPLVRILVRKLTEALCREPIRIDAIDRWVAGKTRLKRIRFFGTIVLVLMAAGVLYLTAGRAVILKNEYAKEKETLSTVAVGDKVKWGHYETTPSLLGKERISWIVLEKNEDSVLLVSESGLAGSYYHQKHEPVTWEECDLRILMNERSVISAFSRYEQKDMMPIDGDMITLLTVEEAQKYFGSDAERELFITQMAEDQGTNTNEMSKNNYWDFKKDKSSWWWLRGQGEASLTAPIVTVDGVISPDEKYVNKPGGAIRPVIRVKIN